MLDWAFTLAVTPPCDLVYAARSLGGGHWAPLSDRPDRRETTWNGLLAGYRDAEPAPDGPLTREAGDVVVGPALDGERLTTERVVERARATRGPHRALATVRTRVLFDGWFDQWGVDDEERGAATDAARAWTDTVV